MTPETVVVCGGCGREIEICALCDRESCGEAICYRCLTVDLGETLAHPHEHGG